MELLAARGAGNAGSLGAPGSKNAGNRIPETLGCSKSSPDRQLLRFVPLVRRTRSNWKRARPMESSERPERQTRTKRIFLCESDPFEGGRAQIGSELDPWSRGSNPNGKPPKTNAFSRETRFSSGRLRRVIKVTLNPFAGDWVVKGWEYHMDKSKRPISRCLPPQKATTGASSTK